MDFKAIKKLLSDNFEAGQAAREAEEPLAAICFRGGWEAALSCLETLDERLGLITEREIEDWEINEN